MTEIIILTGYLGSGKTTTLQNILKKLDKDQKIAVIINEFATVGIDGQTVDEQGRLVAELNSGCVCCSKSQDLKETIVFLKEKYSPNKIILETTGIANVRPVIETANDTGTKIKDVVTVIDAHTYTKTKGFADASKQQITLSSVAIINKEDLVKKQDIKKIKEEINKINPSIKIITTSYGKITLKDIKTRARVDWTHIKKTDENKNKLLSTLFPEMAKDKISKSIHKERYSSLSISTSSLVNKKKFEKIINKNSGKFVRAKGILNFSSEKKPTKFNYASGLISFEPSTQKTNTSNIILIGKFTPLDKIKIYNEITQAFSSRPKTTTKVKDLYEAIFQ